MPALPQIYPYKVGPIEPVVSPGETVGIWVNKVWTFHKIQFIEGITRSDPISINLGAIPVGGVSAITQLTILQMPEEEFAQIRAEVLDDVSVILYQGRADQRHKMQNQVATFSRFNALSDPCAHLTEFYEYEDQFAFIQGVNQTAYALTRARVVFWGLRYVLEKLSEYDWKTGRLPDQWTRIPATAHL